MENEMITPYPLSENDVTLYETDRTRLRCPAMTGAQLRLALNELGDEQMESIAEMLRLANFGDVGIVIASSMIRREEG
jgi:broad specificity phosphatase PhoE